MININRCNDLLDTYALKYTDKDDLSLQINKQLHNLRYLKTLFLYIETTKRLVRCNILESFDSIIFWEVTLPCTGEWLWYRKRKR